MKQVIRRWHRLAAGASALALMAGLTAGARADVAYAYAEQTISGVSIVPTVVGTTLTGTSPLATSTQDSATINGVGISASNPTDTPETYLGSLPAAPENFYPKYAAFPAGTPSPIPTGTLPTGTTLGGGTGNFTRGDAVISGLGTPAASASNVAESYLNGSGTETGNGGFQSSVTFRPSAATALTINYTYANDLYTAISGLASAQANYKFNVTIKHTDGTGAQVIDFNLASPNTNLNLSAPPNGGEIIRSGSESFTTGTLTGGTEYTLIITGTESTAVASIPEPGPMALAALAGGLAGVVGLKRKLTRKGASS